MFLNIVKADGTAEQAVIREMKARAAGARGDIEQIVRGVMADVQQRGWDAVVEYAERFDGKAPYIVEPKVLDDAYNACDPKLIAALEKAAANIRDYHEQMLVKTWEWNRSGGETLGQTVRGLSRVGIYVPGGTAAYPSSVLMNAIPAKVAGVGELIMVTPPTENMSNEVLAAAKIAGVDTVIAIGGTQAIAALTYGAGFIPQVDKIVGPGNAFVAAAKKLAFGTVDIDMNDFGIRTELLGFANRPVIKTRTEHYQQIRLLQNIVGAAHAVHPQHTQRQRMRFWQHAQRH